MVNTIHWIELLFTTMIGPEKSPGNPEDIVRHIYNSRVRLQHIFQGS